MCKIVKMASRAGPSRRVPENDSSIAYVQADGLVITHLFTYYQSILLKFCFETMTILLIPYGNLT